MEIGKRGWDSDDPAEAMKYLRAHGFYVGCGRSASDTGDVGVCIHCGLFAPYKFGERVIRGSWLEKLPDECAWCVRRLGLTPPWTKKYELPSYQ